MEKTVITQLISLINQSANNNDIDFGQMLMKIGLLLMSKSNKGDRQKTINQLIDIFVKLMQYDDGTPIKTDYSNILNSIKTMFSSSSDNNNALIAKSGVTSSDLQGFLSGLSSNRNDSQILRIMIALYNNLTALLITPEIRIDNKNVISLGNSIQANHIQTRTVARLLTQLSANGGNGGNDGDGGNDNCIIDWKIFYPMGNNAPIISMYDIVPWNPAWLNQQPNLPHNLLGGYSKCKHGKTKNTCKKCNQNMYSDTSPMIPMNGGAMYSDTSSVMPMRGGAMYSDTSSVMPMRGGAMFSDTSSVMPMRGGAMFSDTSSVMPMKGGAMYSDTSSVMPMRGGAMFSDTSSVMPMKGGAMFSDTSSVMPMRGGAMYSDTSSVMPMKGGALYSDTSSVMPMRGGALYSDTSSVMSLKGGNKCKHGLTQSKCNKCNQNDDYSATSSIMPMMGGGTDTSSMASVIGANYFSDTSSSAMSAKKSGKKSGKKSNRDMFSTTSQLPITGGSRNTGILESLDSVATSDFETSFSLDTSIFKKPSQQQKGGSVKSSNNLKSKMKDVGIGSTSTSSVCE